MFYMPDKERDVRTAGKLERERPVSLSFYFLFFIFIYRLIDF